MYILYWFYLRAAREMACKQPGRSWFPTVFSSHKNAVRCRRSEIFWNQTKTPIKKKKKEKEINASATVIILTHKPN